MTTKEEYLTAAEIAALLKALPELDWIKPEGWQAVAGFADWRTIIDDNFLDEPDDKVLELMLQSRDWRVGFRVDCRAYYGIENVSNINDPGDPTWA